ncbi:hypothetical protein GN157_12065 [Flavobacterium rakeshii]|uniref:PepSY domain-containing protein n=1 Tax=Flavobacterium rakeshii TaxID=1038845 RepID=A0A6N8HFF0_9FLAO|nr:hypothetical protein [Flavobacterium rakeshii]MUV04445.1 hypothetical protein [Flavobacterium rakeshii]
MKKLIFASAMLMAAFTATASVTVYYNIPAIYQEQEEIYKEIKLSEIPKKVMDNIHKDYGDYKVIKAKKSDKGNYLLEMKTQDGIELTASFTGEGKLIKIYS